MKNNFFDRHLDDQLCFQIYLAAKNFDQMYKHALKEFGLTFPQYLVLLTLWEEDAVPINYIGSRLHMKMGSLNPMLTRLENSGWINKAISEMDRRVTIVSLNHMALTSKRAIHEAILREVSGCNLWDVDFLLLMNQLLVINHSLLTSDLGSEE